MKCDPRRVTGDELTHPMQRQPEFPHFAAHLCGIPAEAVTELNLSLTDKRDLGGVRGSDNFKTCTVYGKRGNKSRCQHVSKGFYLIPETMQCSESTGNCSRLVREGRGCVPAWWHYEVDCLFSKC